MSLGISFRIRGPDLVYRKFLPITCRTQMCSLTRRQFVVVSRIAAVGCSLVTPFLA